jgi:hypothetical protein
MYTYRMLTYECTYYLKNLLLGVAFSWRDFFMRLNIQGSRIASRPCEPSIFAQSGNELIVSVSGQGRQPCRN